jgi:6-phosphogluconolactonase (cycloisomerase 2 family)
MYVYAYFPEEYSFKIKDSISLQSGSGPRHLTFKQDGKFVYLCRTKQTLTILEHNGLLKKVGGYSKKSSKELLVLQIFIFRLTVNFICHQ